jgi:hypothetical protein
VERQLQHFHAEVDGVAACRAGALRRLGEIAFRPAPIAVFEDEAGITVDGVVAGVALPEVESATLEERDDGRQTGGAQWG